METLRYLPFLSDAGYLFLLAIVSWAVIGIAKRYQTQHYTMIAIKTTAIAAAAGFFSLALVREMHIIYSSNPPLMMNILWLLPFGLIASGLTILGLDIYRGNNEGFTGSYVVLRSCMLPFGGLLLVAAGTQLAANVALRIGSYGAYRKWYTFSEYVHVVSTLAVIAMTIALIGTVVHAILVERGFITPTKEESTNHNGITDVTATHETNTTDDTTDPAFAYGEHNEQDAPAPLGWRRLDFVGGRPVFVDHDGPCDPSAHDDQQVIITLHNLN